MVHVSISERAAAGDDYRPKLSAMEKATRRDELVGQSLTSRYSEWVMEALDDLAGNFLISDPEIPGHPIVFASAGFLAMSGYDRADVLGKNGRIFQGPGTDRRSLIEIREAIREERTMEITILNYRMDGTPLWVLFHLFPVFGTEDGRVVNFVAVQVPVSRKPVHEQRRVVGSCRREVCGEVELLGNLTVDSLSDSGCRENDAEESCEAGEVERQKAAEAAACVLSTLIHCSELTGRRVCRARGSSLGFARLPSSLTIPLGRIKQSFVLSDPHLPGMPIVYASDAFLSLTGYSRSEVLGRNCRFLSGPETGDEALHQITQSIQASKPCTVRILNYRKDESTFWNILHVSPVRSATGKIAFYVGVQRDEAAKADRHGLSPEMKQLGAVGAVKVAVRSLSFGVGASRAT
ncbi:PAS/LOV protein B [Wolffia australiana]